MGFLTQRKQSKTPPFSLSFRDKSLKNTLSKDLTISKLKQRHLQKKMFHCTSTFLAQKQVMEKAGVLIASLANLWLKQPLKKSLQSPLTICMLELEVEIFGRIQTVSSVAML